MEATTRASHAARAKPLASLVRGLLSGALGLVGGVIHWAPVWLPLGFLALVALRGLQPALWEARRLAAAEKTVRPRHLRNEQTFLGMQAEVEAWGDPVYRERRRRLRVAQGEERKLVAPRQVAPEQIQGPQPDRPTSHAPAPAPGGAAPAVARRAGRNPDRKPRMGRARDASRGRHRVR